MEKEAELEKYRDIFKNEYTDAGPKPENITYFLPVEKNLTDFQNFMTYNPAVDYKDKIARKRSHDRVSGRITNLGKRIGYLQESIKRHKADLDLYNDSTTKYKEVVQMYTSKIRWMEFECKVYTDLKKRVSELIPSKDSASRPFNEWTLLNDNTRNSIYDNLSLLVQYFNEFGRQVDKSPVMYFPPGEEQLLEDLSQQQDDKSYGVVRVKGLKVLLNASGLLESETVDAYFNLIMERNRQLPDLPKVFVVNCDAFSNQDLRKTSSTTLLSFQKEIRDPAEVRFILLPFIKASHWSCFTVDMKNKKIFHDDSLGIHTRHAREKAKHITENLLPVLFPGRTFADYTLVPSSANTPQQANGYDCGVFTCRFAETSARGARNFLRINKVCCTVCMIYLCFINRIIAVADTFLLYRKKRRITGNEWH